MGTHTERIIPAQTILSVSLPQPSSQVFRVFMNLLIDGSDILDLKNRSHTP